MYGLGQLPEEERNRFEEHFFDCPECMAGVRAAYLMTRGAEVTLKHPIFGAEVAKSPTVTEIRPRQPAPARPVKWWVLHALPYAAILLLSVGTGVEYVALQMARSPQSVVAFAVRAQAKGAPTKIVLPAAGGSVELDLDLMDEAPQYEFEIRSVGYSRALMKREMPRPTKSPVLKVVFPADGLRPGAYEAIIRAAPGHEAIYPFDVDVEGQGQAGP